MNHDIITIFLPEPCVVNLVTFLLHHDCIRLVRTAYWTSLIMPSSLLLAVNSLFRTCYNNWEQAVRTQRFYVCTRRGPVRLCGLDLSNWEQQSPVRTHLVDKRTWWNHWGGEKGKIRPPPHWEIHWFISTFLEQVWKSISQTWPTRGSGRGINDYVLLHLFCEICAVTVWMYCIDVLTLHSYWATHCKYSTC
jgi:hypothetical protein